MKPFSRHILTLCAALVLAIPVPAQQLRTVVIDPGHGGKDPGCVSRDKKTYEKDIVLDIGKRLAQKISAAYQNWKTVPFSPTRPTPTCSSPCM